MQKNTLLLSCTTLLATACIMIAACKKETKYLAAFDDTSGKAFVRIVHASPRFRRVFNQPDSFHVFANGAKLTSSFLTYGSTFPNSTANPYAALDPGTIEFKLSVAGVVNVDSIQITKLSKTLLAGNYYSFIITDSLTSTAQDSSRIWIRDNFSVPQEHLTTVRFVHAVMNDTAGKAIDLYSTRRNGNLLTNYTPSKISTFFTIPYNQQVSDTLIVRRTGTTFELTRLNTVSLGNQRVYTIVYRGNGDSAAAAKAWARSLTYYINK